MKQADLILFDDCCDNDLRNKRVAEPLTGTELVTRLLSGNVHDELPIDGSSTVNRFEGAKLKAG